MPLHGIESSISQWALYGFPVALMISCNAVTMRLLIVTMQSSYLSGAHCVGGKNRMFVALSRFVIANDMTEQVKEAFMNRPHLVEAASGFVRLEVISPLDNLNEIWLLTYWHDENSFKVWHHSHLYRDSHKGIPKGLKLVPGSTQLRFFEHVCS
jgi:heme-degrading monooxygenase HmoA